MPQEDETDFRDPTSLAKWTKWMLCAYIAATVAALILSNYEHRLLLDLQNRAIPSRAEAAAAARASDARQVVIAQIQFFLFLASGYLLLKWIHRANHNARQLGASGMTFSPGWSIGYYFIPGFNIWKPYQAMKEIWAASASLDEVERWGTSIGPDDWRKPPNPPLLLWWWLLWLGSELLAHVSIRFMITAERSSQVIIASQISRLHDAITIPLCLTVIAIVNRVHAMQIAHASAADV